jgi:hypothetical protein
MISALSKAIKTNNRWYKNCKNVRKRNGKICSCCPFRSDIESIEKLLRRKHARN